MPAGSRLLQQAIHELTADINPIWIQTLELEPGCEALGGRAP